MAATGTHPLARSKAPEAWVESHEGRWHVREDQVERLAPEILCLDTGRFPPSARCVRETPKRSVWHWRSQGADAGGWFIKAYRAPGIIQAIRRLMGTEPARREWRAAQRLRRRGVPTYEVVALGSRGRLWEGAQSYIITREIAESRTLMEALGDRTAKGDGFRQMLMDELARTIAALHERGVEHLDLHGGNLLVQSVANCPVFFLVDLQRVRISAHLSQRRRTRDLARLLHSLHGYLNAEERETFVSAYGARGGFRPSLTALHQRVEALRRRRLRSRTSRCLQGGSSFAREKTGARQVHYSREFPIALLDSILEEASTMKGRGGSGILKDSSETTITRHSAAAEGRTWKVCVKRYHVRGPWDRIKYAWRKSRARRSWLAAWGLRVRGVRTPMPWALVENRSWQIPGEAAVVMEDLQGARPLNQYVAEFFDPHGRGHAKRHREFVLVLAEFFYRLHAQEIFHRDLKGTNVLVQDNGDGWRISLVDLDHVRLDRALTLRERTLNLAQLNASIPSCVGTTARLRFLGVYSKGYPREIVRAMAFDILEISKKR